MSEKITVSVRLTREGWEALRRFVTSGDTEHGSRQAYLQALCDKALKKYPEPEARSAREWRQFEPKEQK